MSRTKRFLAGTLAGYGSIAANIAYTLVSIPLALAFLGKEEFGLWLLAAQINGYLSLLDLGMGNATNRFIADHKDHINGGDYGSHLITSALVYIIQGMVMMVGGLGLAIIGPELLAIPNNLVWEFRMSILLLAINSGLSIASKAMGSALWAFQRTDVINICFTIISLSGLGFLWLGFTMNLGLLALPIALYPGTLIVALLCYVVSKRNGYFPCKGNWGRPCTKTFKKMFNYGKDSFMIQLGNQLVNASQIIIISRMISLETAATYAIGTKVFMLARMLLSAPISSASPILTEIHVRGETSNFRNRFHQLLGITLAFATVAASSIAVSNSTFVSLWTQGEVIWNWKYDLILAFTLTIRAYTTSLNTLFAITKNLKSIRLAPFLEGVCFVFTASIACKSYGLMGILICSLFSHLVCTALWYNCRGTQLAGRTSPRLPQVVYIIAIMCAASYVASVFDGQINEIIGVIAINVISVVATCMVAWFVVLKRSTRSEIKDRHLYTFTRSSTESESVDK